MSLSDQTVIRDFGFCQTAEHRSQRVPARCIVGVFSVATGKEITAFAACSACSRKVAGILGLDLPDDVMPDYDPGREISEHEVDRAIATELLVELVQAHPYRGRRSLMSVSGGSSDDDDPVDGVIAGLDDLIVGFLGDGSGGEGLRDLVMEMSRQLVVMLPEDSLAQLVDMYQAEWERRNPGERWTLARDA